MNYDWAIERLEDFIEALDAEAGTGTFWAAFTASDNVKTKTQTAMRIVEELMPGKQLSYRARPDGEPLWPGLRNAAVEAIGLARDKRVLDDQLAPRLRADLLHPTVWRVAQTFWNSGHRREAVQQAARAVNAALQSKIGRRDVSESKAVQEAFKLDSPQEDKPRLRLMDNDGSVTYRSLHEGVLSFGVGCFKALRNPDAHELADDELSQHEALEQLAAWSLLARWVDRARRDDALELDELQWNTET